MINNAHAKFKLINDYFKLEQAIDINTDWELPLNKLIGGSALITWKYGEEADLGDFIIHNKQLGGQVDNIGIPKGCPPRCAHCWFLSDGVKVIGND